MNSFIDLFGRSVHPARDVLAKLVTNFLETFELQYVYVYFRNVVQLI